MSDATTPSTPISKPVTTCLPGYCDGCGARLSMPASGDEYLPCAECEPEEHKSLLVAIEQSDTQQELNRLLIDSRPSPRLQTRTFENFIMTTKDQAFVRSAQKNFASQIVSTPVGWTLGL
ncbi:MAG: hypothetical protein HOC20_13940 [Chloroflexi bacterium]|jgi:hypothetical protein|nr:hypothetical protein [Chloroflexota bacterium]